MLDRLQTGWLKRGLWAGLVILPAAGFAADAAHPTVVEEYQSQGCSSCPPANANLNAIADRPEILALSFSVTYWDRLGWTDTFGNMAFTDRQWDYARAGGRSNVYTPQMVVNGGDAIVGNSLGEVEAAIRAGDRGTGGPTIAWGNGSVSIAGPGAGAQAVVWLVRYDPRTLEVPVRGGENAGRTLPHRNIVKELVSLGGWTSGSASFALPAPGDPALKTALLVQEGLGGRIIAAAKMP
ncbi:DUF1223 domain-containing protein [bacterium]|nr:DUF1223 domain-containing protein [bacterium]